MSFIIAVYVNEGIVLASDRRTTYTITEKKEDKIIQKIGIHTTDSTDKTFICPNGAGISTCGTASLQNKPITGFIQEMIRTQVSTETKISEMPKIICDYFAQFEEKIDTDFLIAGYEIDENGVKKQKVLGLDLKTGSVTARDTSSQGAVWDGETATIVRLVVADSVKQKDGSFIDVPQEGILWQYFTLQDAVDFAKYAVETTVKTMHFKNVVETVGGSVDILVITPDKTEWLQKEVLKVKD